MEIESLGKVQIEPLVRGELQAVAVVGLAIDAQLASLLAQELLAEPRGLAAELELDLTEGVASYHSTGANH